MKSFLTKYWPPLTIAILILIGCILYFNWETIRENKYTKMKLEILKAAQEKDIDKVKNVIDSFRIKEN